jgi:hypothetical protein
LGKAYAMPLIQAANDSEVPVMTGPALQVCIVCTVKTAASDLITNKHDGHIYPSARPKIP